MRLRPNYGASTYGYPDLAEGADGPMVCELQRRLIAAGADTGEDTTGGVYGPDTTQAVTNFQNAYGLPATGTVGPSAWSRLIDATPGVSSQVPGVDALAPGRSGSGSSSGPSPTAAPPSTPSGTNWLFIGGIGLLGYLALYSR